MITRAVRTKRTCTRILTPRIRPSGNDQENESAIEIGGGCSKEAATILARLAACHNLRGMWLVCQFGCHAPLRQGGCRSMAKARCLCWAAQYRASSPGEPHAFRICLLL